jgi:hypothetical protein
MNHTFSDGKTVDLETQLDREVAAFKQNPNTIAWKRTQLAMLSYQQCKFAGIQELIFNIESVNAWEVEELVQKINTEHGDIL